MKNFLVVLRLAACSRGRIVLVVICSLGIGGLWGANIGVFLPFLDTVFYGETASQSLERRIELCNDTVKRYEMELRQLTEHGEPVGSSRARSLRDRAESYRIQSKRLRSWQPFLERWLPATPFGTIVWVLGFLIGATLLKGLLMTVNDAVVAQLTQSAVFQLRGRLFRHALTLDPETFTDDRTSTLMSRFTQDLQRVGEAVRAVLGQSLREPFKMLACLIGAALISWPLLVLSFAILPIGLLVFAAVSRIQKRLNSSELATISDLYCRLSESFQGIRAVRTFACEGQERRRFHVVSRRVRKQQIRTGFARAFVKPSFELLGMGVVSIGVLAGGWAVLSQQTHIGGVPLFSRPLSPAALLVFFAMLVGATDPLRKLGGLSVAVNRGAAASDRVFRLLERVPAVRSPKGGVKIESSMPRIELSDVTFRYRRQERAALQSVHLTVEPGECVAVIGANGSGKSTVLDLLLRLHDPRSGAIRVDGVDLREIDLQHFRRMTGVIPQKGFLFDESIALNIRCGNPWSSDDDIEAAARQAGAHDFIVGQLAEGYHTQVGEGGARLSGGQGQQISLARAMLRKPKLLLMDEPTSALDALAEAALIARLKPFLEGRTCLMVTHRAPLLALASRIVLLDEGRVIESGAHAELLARSSLYRRMLHEPPENAA